MKRVSSAIIAAVVISVVLAGCQNATATFSNSDGHFVLSSNGTYTQTLPQVLTRSDKKQTQPSFDTLPNTGSWRLISPSDGPSNSGFKVELSGARRCSVGYSTNDYTLVVDANSIRGFDKLLGEQQAKSSSSAP